MITDDEKTKLSKLSAMILTNTYWQSCYKYVKHPWKNKEIGFYIQKFLVNCFTI